MSRFEPPSQACFFARWVLGLTFFMAGWWKVLELGPVGHAQRYFLDGFADTWIPETLLWALGTTIPGVELVAGGLVCLGLWRRFSYALLGVVLVIVTYGHLLAEPLFSLQGHIFIRLALLLFLLMVPLERDRLSLDELLAGRGSE